MFKDRLRSARKAKNYTLQQMADFLDMGLRSYQHYESGKNYPPIENLVKIATILGVSLDYLCDLDGYKKQVEELVDELKTNPPKYPTFE